MQKSSCVRKLLDQGNAKQKTSCINTTNREITPLPLPLKMISSGIILRMHAISKARMHPQTIHCGDELQFRANSVFHQLLRRTVLMPNAFSYHIAYNAKMLAYYISYIIRRITVEKQRKAMQQTLSEAPRQTTAYKFYF